MEFAFDDEMFEDDTDEPTIQVQVQTIYVPKKEPFGFFLVSDAHVDELDSLRMKANYFYITKSFDQALQCYQRAAQLAASNGAKFEFREAAVRCLAALGQNAEAVAAAISLYEVCANFDQQVQALNAWKDILASAQLYGDCAIVLGVLLTYFDTNDKFWKSLAQCFANWNGAELAHSEQTFISLCASCLSKCRFACLVRYSKLSNEASTIPCCPSDCGNVDRCQSKADAVVYERSMCGDLKCHSSDEEHHQQWQHDGTKIDKDISSVFLEFVKKWFSFFISLCPLCNKL